VPVLSREKLKALIELPAEMGISIYMPTHRVVDTKQDQIRLKNLLREGEKKLIDSGVRATEVRQLLEPAEKLSASDFFWQHQSEGLAIFSSPGIFRYFRLPYSPKELVVVAERFHTKPLVSLLSGDGLFYVLALSQNEVRLLQCSSDNAWVITPERVPTSLAEALKYDEFERQLQFHTGTGTGPGKRSAIFHGQGVGVDDAKDNILRYFREIDRGLHELLRDEQAPLVLAGVDYLHSIYQQANTYPHLLQEGVQGNVDGMSAKELQKRAWKVMRPYFERGQLEALKRYGEAVGKGLTVKDVKQVVLAAYDGRVDTLFVAVGVQNWGVFDSRRRQVHLYEKAEKGAQDLLDLAAALTLTRGGTVYAAEPEKVPSQSAIAAILRY
jgi:hypothetical protein